jgi:hypothetical protein
MAVSLGSKMLSKITIHGEFKAFALQGFNKSLNISRIFATNGKTINPLNKNHARVSPQTWIVVCRLKSEVAWDLGQVFEKQARCDTKPMKTFDKLEAAPARMRTAESARQVKKDWRLIIRQGRVQTMAINHRDRRPSIDRGEALGSSRRRALKPSHNR